MKEQLYKSEITPSNVWAVTLVKLTDYQFFRALLPILILMLHYAMHLNGLPQSQLASYFTKQCILRHR